MKHLTKELADVRAALRNEKLKSKARLSGLGDALESMETELARRRDSSRRALHDIQNAVSDLQRHLGSRGYHAVPSETARALLQNLWTTVGSLAAAVKGDVPEVSASFEAADAEAEKAAWEIGARSGSLKIHGTSPTKDLARTMSDMCGEMEKDNLRLQAEVSDLRAALEASRNSVGLIPKYRKAIVKSRSIAQALRAEIEALRRERIRDAAAMAGLREREDLGSVEEVAQTLSDTCADLEQENATLRGKMVRMQETRGQTARLREENATLRGQMAAMQEENAGLRARAEAQGADFRASIDALSSDKLRLKAHMAAMRTETESAEGDLEVATLRGDLATLDDEIGQLQRAIKGALI